MSESEILNELPEPETMPVTRNDNKPLENHMPKYLVLPVELSLPLGGIKLIDFGESFDSVRPPAKITTPMELRAPEILLGEGWNHTVDLWSVGCLVSWECLYRPIRRRS